MRWGRKGEWVLFERFVIGPESDPYMIRCRIFECPWFRVFFHRILRSDSDRHLHDHPFNFVSFMVRGCYTEIREQGSAGIVYSVPSIIFRRATDRHRLVIGDRPAWTLVLAGRRLREWGFMTEQGWVAWREYQEAW